MGVEITDGNYEKAKTFSLMFYDTTTIFTFEDFGFNRDDRSRKKLIIIKYTINRIDT